MDFEVLGEISDIEVIAAGREDSRFASSAAVVRRRAMAQDEGDRPGQKEVKAKRYLD